MISAKEAYEKSKESAKRNVEKALKQIEEAIAAAAERGEFSVYFREKHGEFYDAEVVKILKDKGFRIRMDCAEIDDYGYYYCKYLKISWKSREGKHPWLVRISKILFGDEI